MAKQKTVKQKDIPKLLANKTIKQLVKYVCGEKIGSGLNRDVYILKDNPNFVVKIERDMSKATFANATEWRNYIDNRDWIYVRDYFAPCLCINENSQVLVQQRITHKPRKFYPKYIPGIFTDLKVSNFGWIGKQFVCCDYSFLRFHTVRKNNLMIYAKWWGKAK